MSGSFEDYYIRQATGHGLPVFSGVRTQRGHGLGNLLTSAFRVFLPVLKSTGKSVLKQGLSTGADILGDLVRGRSLKQAAKTRVKEGGSRLLKRAADALNTKKTIKKKKKKKRGSKAAAVRDIFSFKKTHKIWLLV